MTIFDVLTLIGGLCLFLFGMQVMGDGLERRAGGSLKVLLGRLTGSKFKGFLTGLGVTSVIQSSSATTVMVVGFVNSKVMTLKQAIGVIMAANIGTTVTAWILSLGGISGNSLFLKLLKPTSFTPVLALIGTTFLMFSKSEKKRDVGTVLLGFATLMFGMDTMSGAVSGLADMPSFRQLFLLFSNPILGVLVGGLLTAVIQSSSASVGILQALSATGAVTFASAIPIIMGQNIGTCVTALLSSFGTNKNAKRAAVVHLSFNVIGTVVWLTVFSVVSALFRPSLLQQPATYAGIAMAHSVFNILCTLLLYPMSSLLEKLAYKIVPEGKEKEPEKRVELDDRLLLTPAVALAESERVALKMGERAAQGLNDSLSLLTDYTPERAAEVRAAEKDTDRYEDLLGTYLTRLSRRQITAEDSTEISKLLKAIGDFERIADHSVNILESAEELREKKTAFSLGAAEDLRVLCRALSDILTLTLTAFRENDPEKAAEVEPLEQVIDGLRTALRDGHIVRLKSGECTVEAGFIWSDLLTNMERAADHCSNIAACIIEAGHQDMDLHAFLHDCKREEAFRQRYHALKERYCLPSRVPVGE